LGTKFIKLIYENLANEGYMRMDLDTAKNNISFDFVPAEKETTTLDILNYSSGKSV
jgi:hypothetical protein